MPSRRWTVTGWLPLDTKCALLLELAFVRQVGSAAVNASVFGGGEMIADVF